MLVRLVEQLGLQHVTDDVGAVAEVALVDESDRLLRFLAPDQAPDSGRKHRRVARLEAVQGIPLTFECRVVRDLEQVAGGLLDLTRRSIATELICMILQRNPQTHWSNSATGRYRSIELQGQPTCDI